MFHPDLNVSENEETTTIFANVFQWLTNLITNSLEFIANFNLSGSNFYTVFIIFSYAGSRNHLVPSIFSLWKNLLNIIKLPLNFLFYFLYIYMQTHRLIFKRRMPKRTLQTANPEIH